MNKKRIKSQKGFAATDALIAILIVSLFTGLIATLSYNVYATSVMAKRNVEADSYIIDFFEHVDLISFNNVTNANLTGYINSDLDDEKISATNGNINSLTTPYKVKIQVQDYHDYDPEANATTGLVKIVTFTIKYSVGKRENTIEIRHVKTNENVV